MSWQEAVLEHAARAPGWMRERASADLEVAVAQARLDTPVLDVAGLDEAAADRALTFFLCVSLASGARIARVRCGHGPSDALARRAKRALGRSIARLDVENAALMGYFDVHLRETTEMSPSAAASLVRRLRRAIDADDDASAEP
ncbi:MAG: hypothetical protein FJ144_06995 [Deltaproteobacteria bacterium]|nr:hypothetical protein [Deltaproteobacteria bacterium]